MADKCFCGMNLSDLMISWGPKDDGFRKVICKRCGKEFFTDIKDKVCCFECEKQKN